MLTKHTHTDTLLPFEIRTTNFEKKKRKKQWSTWNINGSIDDHDDDGTKYEFKRGHEFLCVCAVMILRLVCVYLFLR